MCACPPSQLSTSLLEGSWPTRRFVFIREQSPRSFQELRSLGLRGEGLWHSLIFSAVGTAGHDEVLAKVSLSGDILACKKRR